MITCGTQIVSGSTGGGGASLPATPASALLDAGNPSTMLGLNASGVGQSLSASQARSRMGLGSLATASTVTASQISDATSDGRALLTAGDVAAQRATLGLGGAAVLAVGTTAGTVAAGDDSRITGAIAASTLTTRGDLIRRGASAPERVALGTNGQVLTSNGTDPVWATPSGGGSTWLSLYGGTALYMGGDAATGWSSSDRFSASAGALVPAFGPGQSMAICLYPKATPTGVEILTAHISTTSTRGWYLSIGANAGARLRLALFQAGLNGAVDLYLTGSDVTVGAAYCIAICVKADKSVRYSVNGAAVATVAALAGTYTAPTTADILRVGTLTEYSPTFYPPTSEIIGDAVWYSTELSDADLVAACADRALGTIPTVASGTISAAFRPAAFAGGRRVVEATPTPTWIAAGNPAIRPV
jgi:hypothetical protein